jgi:hypothetical protein
MDDTTALVREHDEDKQQPAGGGRHDEEIRGQPPVEACIALSILFVAREIVQVHRGRPGITARWSWVGSFTFGLMHEFGFAGALTEVGLPQSSIPAALLFFNVGVEIGQLMFVGTVLTVIAVSWRAAQRLRVSQPPEPDVPGTSGRHYHPGHSFTWILEGSETCVVNGKPPRVVKSGDVLHEEPQQVH